MPPVLGQLPALSVLLQPVFIPDEPNTMHLGDALR